MRSKRQYEPSTETKDERGYERGNTWIAAVAGGLLAGVLTAGVSIYTVQRQSDDLSRTFENSSDSFFQQRHADNYTEFLTNQAALDIVQKAVLARPAGDPTSALVQTTRALKEMGPLVSKMQRSCSKVYLLGTKSMQKDVHHLCVQDSEYQATAKFLLDILTPSVPCEESKDPARVCIPILGTNGTEQMTTQTETDLSDQRQAILKLEDKVTAAMRKDLKVD